MVVSSKMGKSAADWDVFRGRSATRISSRVRPRIHARLNSQSVRSSSGFLGAEHAYIVCV